MSVHNVIFYVKTFYSIIHLVTMKMQDIWLIFFEILAILP